MKRIIAFFLTVLIVLSCTVPARAVVTQSRYPVIEMYGDGMELTDSERNIPAIPITGRPTKRTRRKVCFTDSRNSGS